jgi:hypothetical protein
MDKQLARAIGERVRARRTAGGRKKTVVAGLAGILGVSVAELLGQEPTVSNRPANTAAGEAIYCALVNPMLTTSEAPLVVEAHARVVRAWRT